MMLLLNVTHHPIRDITPSLTRLPDASIEADSSSEKRYHSTTKSVTWCCHWCWLLIREVNITSPLPPKLPPTLPPPLPPPLPSPTNGRDLGFRLLAYRVTVQSAWRMIWKTDRFQCFLSTDLAIVDPSRKHRQSAERKRCPEYHEQPT